MVAGKDSATLVIVTLLCPHVRGEQQQIGQLRDRSGSRYGAQPLECIDVQTELELDGLVLQ